VSSILQVIPTGAGTSCLDTRDPASQVMLVVANVYADRLLKLHAVAHFRIKQQIKEVSCLRENPDFVSQKRPSFLELRDRLIHQDRLGTNATEKLAEDWPFLLSTGRPRRG
jgi:hypothetical protein